MEALSWAKMRREHPILMGALQPAQCPGLGKSEHITLTDNTSTRSGGVDKWETHHSVRVGTKTTAITGDDDATRNQKVWPRGARRLGVDNH